MRRKTFVAAALLVCLALQPALGLSTDDDMAAWAAAPAGEKSGLADQIMSKSSASSEVSRSELLDCLNLASSVSGHQHLPISEVAEACLHPSGPGDRAQLGAAPGWRRAVEDGPT